MNPVEPRGPSGLIMPPSPGGGEGDFTTRSGASTAAPPRVDLRRPVPLWPPQRRTHETRASQMVETRAVAGRTRRRAGERGRGGAAARRDSRRAAGVRPVLSLCGVRGGLPAGLALPAQPAASRPGGAGTRHHRAHLTRARGQQPGDFSRHRGAPALEPRRARPAPRPWHAHADRPAAARAHRGAGDAGGDAQPHVVHGDRGTLGPRSPQESLTFPGAAAAAVR